MSFTPVPRAVRHVKRALITGASSGIGRATAELFAERGIDVGVLSNDRVAVDAVVDAITAAGGSAFPVYADLTNSSEVAGLFDRIEHERGPVDILINCAGIGLQADILETTDADVESLYAVNVTATIILSRDALRRMAGRGRGHIVNITSAVATRALPGMSIYSSTKAAVHVFTQALRVEAAGTGVHVIEVIPMSVSTPFFDAAVNRSNKPYGPRFRNRSATPQQVAARIWRAIQWPTAEVYLSPVPRLVQIIQAISTTLVEFVLIKVRRRELPAAKPVESAKPTVGAPE